MSGSRGLQDTSTPAAAVSAGGDAGLRDTSTRTAGDAGDSSPTLSESVLAQAAVVRAALRCSALPSPSRCNPRANLAVGPSHSDDDERPRKKGRLDAGTGQGLVTQGVSTKKVLNQGKHRTCVGYAFSRVMTECLHEKYGIACDAAKFVEKVKALCPCWEGHETEDMLREWNEQHAPGWGRPSKTWTRAGATMSRWSI